MTPKEKAKELINKFIKLTSKHEKFETAGLGAITLAKQCALIAVDEIKEAVMFLDDDSEDFWFEVKQEIKKL